MQVQKKGCGAYWGRKKDAKKESRRTRRETDRNETILSNIEEKTEE